MPCFQTLAIFALSFLLSQPVWAVDPPPKTSRVVAYSSRPDVLQAKPVPHPELGSFWVNLRRGHLEAAVMLLEMYRDRDIYFLARDAEHLYDLARVLARNDPTQLKRLHLLNVSQLNRGDRHLSDYLVQEGISAQNLEDREGILLVDTGFFGSTPSFIAATLPEEWRSKVQAHLMATLNPNYPSDRGFFTSLEPMAPLITPRILGANLLSYENLERHFTAQSTGFAMIDGRWEAVSPPISEAGVTDGRSELFQEDLLAYGVSAETEALAAVRRAQWRKLRELVDHPELTRRQLIRRLKAMLKEGGDDPFIEAAVRDFVEMRRLNFPGGPSIEVKDLWQVPASAEQPRNISNAVALATRHPEWSEVLKDPKDGISRALRSGRIEDLSAMIPLVHDAGFFYALGEALSTEPVTERKQALALEVANSAYPRMRKAFAATAFRWPSAVQMRDALRVLIEQGDQETLEVLAHGVFATRSAVEMKDLFELLIEKADSQVMQAVIVSDFREPYSTQLTDSLTLLVHRADPEALQKISREVLWRPHWKKVASRICGLMGLIQAVEGH